VLTTQCSDHKPLLVTFSNKKFGEGRQKKSFKFEHSWTSDEECGKKIKVAWNQMVISASPQVRAQEKLENCQQELSRWSSKKFGRSEVKLKEKKKLLAVLQQQECPKNLEAIKKIQGDIDILLEQEDRRWKQRAKQHWYQHGDRNTKFFHAWTQHRKKINTIWKIEDEHGCVWKEKADIHRAFVQYYTKLFTTEESVGVVKCLSGIEQRVTNDMNTQLLKEFTANEISVALAQMQPLKSPGPDGFTACFYQKFWPTVGREVCQAVLGFLNTGILDGAINSTYIALIPKKKSPTKVTEYRPISLCNVLYKLISKVLANRLKKILPSIISKNQSAFVPGRLITDNILVAFEALHTMQSRMKRKNGYMALKLDMSKAYDRVE
jgi:hypothetical protein